jgi:hypothetical protein
LRMGPERWRGDVRGAYPVTARDRREARHGRAGGRMPQPAPRAAPGIRPGSSSPPRCSEDYTNSRNILLVSYCLHAVRGRHGNQPPAAASSRGHRKPAGHGPHRPDHHRCRAHGANGARGAGRQALAGCQPSSGRLLSPDSARAAARSGVPPDQPGRSLRAGVRVVVVVPGRCVRLEHCGGGGQLAVAYLYGQLGDRRDLGYLKRRFAGDLGRGLGHIAEVRE